MTRRSWPSTIGSWPRKATAGTPLLVPWLGIASALRWSGCDTTRLVVKEATVADLIDMPGGGQLPSVEFVQAILDRITYKPGWRFWIATTGTTVNGSYRQWLWAKSDVDDSRGAPPRPDFTRAMPMDWPDRHEPTEATIVARVRAAVQQWEVHEANEFLHLDGEIIHDPHECPQCVIGGCRA